ncbi:MAG: 50S ribosomal protein L3 [Chitinispirillaceae bacterium]|nr:50S ribosomal protein L3 [Chitinispirillaceae bacterium]
MQGLIGKKIGMTRMFEKETGRALSVTVIKAADNVVHQVKTVENDGYAAVQLGFGAVSEKKANKPLLGHCKKCGSTPTRVIKEFALDTADEKIQPGSKVGVELFENVKLVDVIGISKGRGFAGTIKRHHFMRGRESHGSGCTRERGSMGSNTYPAHVWKGLRMSGHMGNKKATIRNVALVGIDKEAGLVFVNGSVPGPAGGIVFIRKLK